MVLSGEPPILNNDTSLAILAPVATPPTPIKPKTLIFPSVGKCNDQMSGAGIATTAKSVIIETIVSERNKRYWSK
jgi:hypothetical protein